MTTTIAMIVMPKPTIFKVCSRLSFFSLASDSLLQVQCALYPGEISFKRRIGSARMQKC